MNNEILTIALAKGRLGKEAYKLLNKTNLANNVDLKSRKLIFNDELNRIRYFYVKPTDVVTYVLQGVADLGIVGKDNILEEAGDLYELLDLEMGACKFSIAGKKGQRVYRDEALKVATKYPNIAKNYFKEKQQKIEVIKLNGSVELAPLVGLSDVIVDIVETGNTLRANGLEVLEDMYSISAKLIANRTSYRFKKQEIELVMKLIAIGKGESCD
ncbi:ATP phosphoribosyltransferase [Haloplasma contractile]|uniref:ATP phosphoribosyltransferase n=1 Tax=Haloplasma contractile SSD-17B TaxID=1033810 RepID=U2E9X8_9MOLU|nr:ATP phosphoribosyltransferase [Haloplasma contractile]ERJ11933.1 ATP phosphoribosyltransferase protein [Haloplasma contractile SSD-17B]